MRCTGRRRAASRSSSWSGASAACVLGSRESRRPFGSRASWTNTSSTAAFSTSKTAAIPRSSSPAPTGCRATSGGGSKRSSRSKMQRSRRGSWATSCNPSCTTPSRCASCSPTAPTAGARPPRARRRSGPRSPSRTWRVKALIPELDVLGASPYKRAFETAEIIASAYGDLTVEWVAELTPGASVDRVVAWLTGRHARGSVGLVGHEPDLSRLVCTLLADTSRPFLELRKGAACLLEFPGPVGRGAATLDWFLGPKHLRLLGTAHD